MAKPAAARRCFDPWRRLAASEDPTPAVSGELSHSRPFGVGVSSNRLGEQPTPCLCTRVGLGEKAEALYEDLDEVVRGIPITRKLSLVEILMAISGQLLMALMMSVEALDLGRGMGWNFTTDFAKAFELVIANFMLRRRRTNDYLS
ncbi:hypothetical protein H5410_008885 [Solanum commersonii]|uniref:Uncharacterized protein n=1 Tax=Solanum commersonii TaxID=4109 RepID=A0A9J6AH39_SOLCO|nr:hypothetical protein H5410_008885 [Solanum commersonii]